MSTLREQLLRSHISEHYPNARIVSWDEPDSGLSFYTADQLQQLDADWFPLCSTLDPDTGKVLYGGRNRIIHTYTGGETGAGKTTRFAMQSIRALSSMKGKPSFLVMDIHGELVENLYTHLKENGYDIRILNCDDPSHSDTYNPFASMVRHCMATGQLDHQTVNEIRKIADLIQPLAPSDDPVWYEGARSYTNGAILDKFEDLIRGDIAPEHITLYNILENHYWLRQKLQENKLPNGTCDLLKIPHYEKKGTKALSVQKMLSVTNNAEKTMKSYFGVIENRYDTFGQPSLYQLSSSSTIDVERFIQVPTAIFIQAGNTNVGDDLLSLMTNDIYNTVVRLGKQSATKLLPRKIHCFLDEFANSNIADGPEFIKMLTTSRKFGMYWHMLLQCDAQLDRKFDQNMGRIIRANCTELFMGSHDYETTVRFARSCGQKTVESLGSRVAQQDPSLTVVDLMTPDRLSLLPEGHLYIKTNRSPLLYSYIEAFYRCPEFTRLDDIRSAYPENNFPYQDTHFTPDDINPALTDEEFALLRFIYRQDSVSVYTLPDVVDMEQSDTDALVRRLEKMGYVREDEEREVVISQLLRQDYLQLAKQYSHVPSPPVLTELSPEEFQVMSYIHHRKRVDTAQLNTEFKDMRLAPILKRLENYQLVISNPGRNRYTTNLDTQQFELLESRNGAYHCNPMDDPMYRLFRETVTAIPDYKNLNLSILNTLSCIPAQIYSYLRSATEKIPYESFMAIENTATLHYEIVELFIKNNDFPDKAGWDRGISRELSIIKSLPYLPQEIKEYFIKAANEIRNNLTLSNIREIRKIILG